MTVKEFVKEIEAYYGPYPKGQQGAIVNYLGTKREEFLAFLLDYTYKTFSARFKVPPDIAVFEEAKPKALGDFRQRQRDMEWQELQDMKRKLLPEQVAQVEELENQADAAARSLGAAKNVRQFKREA